MDGEAGGVHGQQVHQDQQQDRHRRSEMYSWLKKIVFSFFVISMNRIVMALLRLFFQILQKYPSFQMM